MVILIFSFKPSGFRSAGVKRGFQFWFWNEFDDTIRGCVFQIFSAHPYEGFFRCNLILWASPNSMLRVTISIAGGDSFVCQSKWYEPEYKIWVPRGQGKVKDNAAQQLRQALVAFFAADPEFPMITDLPFYVFQRSWHFEKCLIRIWCRAGGDVFMPVQHKVLIKRCGTHFQQTDCLGMYHLALLV